MDEKFLEFWGNLLINTAKQKRQQEDVSNLMQRSLETFSQFSHQGVRGFEEIWGMFRKFYGLEHISERSTEYQTMVKKAAEDFQTSFDDYLSMMGMVSKKDHLTLVEKYEKLKAKCEDQEETVRHLRMLLDDVKERKEDTAGNLQGIMKDQAELFQKIITGFGHAISGHNTPDSDDQAKKYKEISKGEVKKNDRSEPDVETDG